MSMVVTVGTIVAVVISALLALLMIPVLVWLERRVCGLIQDRLGPNRTNIAGFRLGGVVQSFADVIKLVVKEEYYPKHISKHRWLFILSPIITFASALLAFMVIPFADNLRVSDEIIPMQALPVDWGILWYLAIGSVGVIGMIFGGWLSHNKYSLLGALRASSQMISYEVALGLGVATVIMVYGTIDFNSMVHWQSGTLFGVLPAWGVIVQPITALIVIIALFVETNRAPFSVAEGESEIVAGFFTEFTAMKFAMFFMGEYVAMNGASAVIITMFFGGYQLPWLSTADLISNIELITVGATVVIPVILYYFVAWMKKNNSVRVTLSTDGGRNFETKVLSWVLFVMGFLAITALWAVVFSNSKDAISIAVTLIQFCIFVTKLMIFNIFFIIIRWTLPRFRYDQVQMVGWRYLLPLSLVNLFVTALVIVGV